MDAAGLDIAIRLLVVLILVGINGFFVAAEFALVSARQTRIEQLAAEGNPLARTVLRSMADPNRFISIAQVGISMASLALGFIGEPAIAAIIDPLLESTLPDSALVVSTHGISIAIAYMIVTYLHLVIGEQVPKMMAIQRAESTILVAAQFTEFVGVLLRPVIAIVYWSTEGILRLFGMKYQSEAHMVYTVDELEMLIEASEEGGHLDPQERELVQRALGFGELTVSQVMVPRTEVVGIPITADRDAVIEAIKTANRSRYPVYEETLDQVVGVLHVKDLVTQGALVNGSFDLRKLIRPVVPVPESLPADELLARLQSERVNMAIVIDEYGGLAGIVTVEDTLEALVGRIQDEFEAVEFDVELLPDGSMLLDGLIGIEEFNRRFGAKLHSETVGTLGGLVFELIGHKPEIGDRVQVDDLELQVEALDGLRIARLRMEPLAASEADAS
ncbi:MAG TPA: hemolysin family protein [Thermomicrobiales bacterium]|nr:hemolysin family protein [Thermomicrobiales bacterium]